MDVDDSFAPRGVTNQPLDTAPVREHADDPATSTDIVLIEQNPSAARLLTNNEDLAQGNSPANSAARGGAAAAIELGLPASSPSAQMAALTKWKGTNELKVFFFGGSDALVRSVLDIAGQWSEFAKMDFKRTTNRASANIRVAFANTGHWSYMGPSNSTGQTMNLQLRRVPQPGEYEFGVVLHEFGHALGCIHEHQQPGASGLFKAQKVIEYYNSNYGWDANKTKLNVLNRYQKTNLLRGMVSRFDKSSIMIYAYPPELTEDNQGTPKNTTLSCLDRKFIAKLYPGRFDPNSLNCDEEPKPDPTEPQASAATEITIDGDLVEDELKPDSQVHHYTFKVNAGSTPTIVRTMGNTKVDLLLFKQGNTTALEAKQRSTPDLINIVEEHALDAGEYRIEVRHMVDGGVGKYAIKLTSRAL